MFYDRFIALCNARGVKPSRVAIDTGFNKGSISVWKKKYIKGEDVVPTGKILNLIAGYFHVSTDYLLGNDEEVDIKDIRYAAYEELENEDEKFVEDILSYIRYKKSQKKKD